jgi:hypothetical protein
MRETSETSGDDNSVHLDWECGSEVPIARSLQQKKRVRPNVTCRKGPAIRLACAVCTGRARYVVIAVG